MHAPLQAGKLEWEVSLAPTALSCMQAVLTLDSSHTKSAGMHVVGLAEIGEA